ncbi:MAG: ASCH domain-containing protein, partial [Bacteroidota bacterium]|nr:ASCH domain-containing protein [Bacteroidota bacterium]
DLFRGGISAVRNRSQLKKYAVRIDFYIQCSYIKKTFKALILNDYPGAPYSDWIKNGKKTIETRHRSFNYNGDVVICCGKTNSVGKNAGKALCIVELWKIRPMRKSDENAASVKYNPGIKSFRLRNWRNFSRDFEFSPQRISGAWQSIFEITIPHDVEIIPRPDIIPFRETEEI